MRREGTDRGGAEVREGARDGRERVIFAPFRTRFLSQLVNRREGIPSNWVGCLVSDC